MWGSKKLLSFLFLLLVVHLYGNDLVYTLKKGETLYRLSRRFNIPVQVLQSYNGIKDPSQIKAGTVIKIPYLYTVKKGDTLYSIARQYGVDLDTLMKINSITDSTRLYVGRKLRIPFNIPSSAVTGQKPWVPASPLEHLPAGQEESQNYPASDALSGKPDDLLWPHPGQRESLDGKVSGILIRGKTGDKVISVSSGRVVWAGPYRGFGRVVFVESGDRYIYVYAGNEKTLVKVGESVNKGTEIGRLGMNVHAGIPQLLFLVYHNGKPVDPYRAPRS